MPGHDMSIHVVSQQLDHAWFLAEALFFPQVQCCESDAFRAHSMIHDLARQLAQEIPAAKLHRLMIAGKPDVETITVALPPPAHSERWTQTLQLHFHALTWAHGDDACIAFVPALGIEVIAQNVDELRRRLPEDILFALRRTKASASLEELAHLQRVTEVTVAGSVIMPVIPTPKERAAGVEEARARQQRRVIEQVGKVLAPYQLPRAYEVDDVVRQIGDVLGRQACRSVLLVGPAGVGKTAAFHEMIRNAGRFNLADRPFWATSAARLIAGMSGFGQWQERCQQLCREAERDHAIVHLGSLVELINTGRGGWVGQGIASFLRPYLARGDMLAVVECTPEQLSLIERQNPHLLEVLQQVRVDEPDKNRCRKILTRVARARAIDGAPRLSEEALDALDRLHRRYAGYSAYPARPLRFLENLLNDFPGVGGGAAPDAARVTAEFSRQTGLPRFLLDDSLPLDDAEARRFFSSRVIGQERAVELVINILMTVKAALNRPRRPIASLLFIGPTGVGKTEMAKSLAEFFFADKARICRFDMSEYATPSAVMRLTRGATSDDGLLTARVREQPFSVILLDEFEKAHPAFFDLLLTVLGEARLSDGAGRVADFSNSVVVMTSNLGAESFQRGRFGLVPRDRPRDVETHFTDAVRSFLRPELFNRIDRIVPFLPLETPTIRLIVQRELDLIRARDGFVQRSLQVEYGPGVGEYLTDAGYDALYGARPLKRLIERELLVPLADGVNSYAARAPLCATVAVREGGSAGLAVSVRQRVDDDAVASAGAARAIADQCVSWRRNAQSLAGCAAALSVTNEIFSIRDNQRRAAARRKTAVYHSDTEPRLARLVAVATCIDGILRDAIALEDQALAVLHAEEGAVPVAPGAVEKLSQSWHDALLRLYALRFDRPDDAVISVFGRNARVICRLAAAYRDIASELGASRFDLYWYRRHGRHGLERFGVEDFRAFLEHPRDDAIGVSLCIGAECIAPRVEVEKGRHIFVDGEARVECIVDVAAGSIKNYDGAADADAAVSSPAVPLVRTYDLDRGQMFASDGRKTQHWTGRKYDAPLAADMAQRLRQRLLEQIWQSR